MGDPLGKYPVFVAWKIPIEIGLVDGNQTLESVEAQGIQGGVKLHLSQKGLRLGSGERLQPLGQSMTDIKPLQFIPMNSRNHRHLGSLSTLKDRPLKDEFLPVGQLKSQQSLLPNLHGFDLPRRGYESK